MEKIVAYYRVSTDRQGKSGLGLEAQRTAVAVFLAGAQVVAEFTEVESGTRSDRPELEKALSIARLHRATLVVSKMDRLTRNVAFLSRLLETGIDIRFADLPQLNGATGRFLIQMMAAVAELEAGMISKRTKDALAAARQRGTKLGGRRYRDGKVVVTASSQARQRATEAVQRLASERATDVAATIQNLQAAGAASARSIADGLNAAGIPTARGGPWTHVQVNRVMARIQA
jgi:DNA invertase Pin-like site-specific DNA recombinase